MILSFFKKINNHVTQLNVLRFFCYTGILGMVGVLIAMSYYLATNDTQSVTILTGPYLFSDFVEAISYFYCKNPYDGSTLGIQSIYLPFAIFMMFPFSLLGKPSITAYLSGNLELEPAYRDPLFLSLYLVFFAINLTLILLVLWKMSGFKGRKLALLYGGVICHAGMLYTFGRANVLLVCFLCTLIFFWLYESPKAWQRELSYVAFAAAAAIKVYPVLIALIFVRDRRWWDLVRTALYTAILVFVPFLFMEGGFNNLPILIQNVIEFSKQQRGRSWANISSDAFWAKIIWGLNLAHSKDYGPIEVILDNIFTPLCFLIVLFASLVRKREGDRFRYCLLVISGYILCASVSYCYVYIFLIIVNLFCFKEFDKMTYVERWIYGFFLAAIAFPLSYYWEMAFAQSIFHYFIFGFATFETIYFFIQDIRKRINPFKNQLASRDVLDESLKGKAAE